MKNKITRKKPQVAFETLKYSAAKLILKKDIEALRKEENGFPFFLKTEYEYKDDKDYLLFIISDFDKDWKSYIKTTVKSSIKERVAYGHCFVTKDAIGVDECRVQSSSF